MTVDSISSLRSLLLAEYVDFDRRLTRRLGSPDLASEALNETYLRLARMRSIAAAPRSAASPPTRSTACSRFRMIGLTRLA
jgi:DNA-directed RNA polymerase specialized sigma24 family protein